MLEHEGRIVSIAGSQAVVAVPTSACSSCGHVGGCSMGRLAQGKSESLLTLDVPAGLQAGDTVRLQLSAEAAARGALLAYALPLAGLLAGGGLASAVFAADLLAAGGAFAGLVLGLVAQRLLPGWQPKPQIAP